MKTLADMTLHPGWWFNLLTTEPLTFASLTGSDGTVAELIDKVFDPSVTLDDLAWLRGVWSRPLIVKGICHPDDARIEQLAALEAVERTEGHDLGEVARDPEDHEHVAALSGVHQDPNRSRMWSPTRRALAMIVRVGLTAPIDTKKPESTT